MIARSRGRFVREHTAPSVTWGGFPTADDLSVVDGVEATAKLHGGRQIGSQREAASQCLAVIPGEHRGAHAEVGGPALTLLVVEVADLVG